MPDELSGAGAAKDVEESVAVVARHDQWRSNTDRVRGRAVHQEAVVAALVEDRARAVFVELNAHPQARHPNLRDADVPLGLKRLQSGVQVVGHRAHICEQIGVEDCAYDRQRGGADEGTS
mgnify:CR=1 FL=1